MSHVMMAAVLTKFGGPEVLELHHDWPRPRPKSHQLVVKVTAAAVNNTDIWTRQGAYGLPEDPSAQAGWLGSFDFPRIQGGDIAGVVVEVGPGVTGELLGRRVLVDPALYGSGDENASPVGFLGSEADGGFAQYVAVDASHAHDVQDSPLSDEQLACLPVAFGTAIVPNATGRHANCSSDSGESCTSWACDASTATYCANPPSASLPRNPTGDAFSSPDPSRAGSTSTRRPRSS